MIERITHRFYDLMDREPAYAELRAMHAPDLAPMRLSLALFLAGWSGGPRDWFDQNPGKCMVSAHKGFDITPEAAVQWADAMGRAIDDIVGESDPPIAKAMSQALGELALSFGRVKGEARG